MIKNKLTYQILFYLKSLIIFSLILFVLIKPIHSVFSDIKKDKTEMSKLNSETDDSEEDSEEEETEKDNIEESLIILFSDEFITLKRSEIINFNHNYTSNYNLGIVSPPPEFV